MQSHISTWIKESFCLSSLRTYANISQVKWGLLPPLTQRYTAQSEGGVSKPRVFQFRSIRATSSALWGAGALRTSPGILEKCLPGKVPGAAGFELLHLLLLLPPPAAREVFEKSPRQSPREVGGCWKAVGFLRLESWFKPPSQPWWAQQVSGNSSRYRNSPACSHQALS